MPVYEYSCANGCESSRNPPPATPAPLSIPPQPAAALASDGRVPAGQTRRSLMPVMSSKRPSGTFKRSYKGASRCTMSAELNTSSDKATAMDSRTTEEKRI